jgi:hypothetical protein
MIELLNLLRQDIEKLRVCVCQSLSSDRDNNSSRHQHNMHLLLVLCHRINT